MPKPGRTKLPHGKTCAKDLKPPSVPPKPWRNIRNSRRMTVTAPRTREALSAATSKATAASVRPWYVAPCSRWTQTTPRSVSSTVSPRSVGTHPVFIPPTDIHPNSLAAASSSRSQGTSPRMSTWLLPDTSPPIGASTSSMNAPTNRASSCIGRLLLQTVSSSAKPPRANGSIPMYISRHIRTGRTALCFRPPPVKAPSVRQAAKSRKTLSPSPVWWAHSAVPTVSPP